MRSERKPAAVVGAGVAPGLVPAAVGPAGAHNYVSTPPSRQAPCAAGPVACGEITHEPQSVEGPKGQTTCSGGTSRFAELDDDSEGWRVTGVGSSQEFGWKLTAAHRTSAWQYFVDGSKIAEVGGGDTQPGSTVTHKVGFDGLTGKKEVLAVWNIADTANAFYACVDVHITA